MSNELTAALPKGTTLHWYEIASVLGQRGFGITYAGLDNNLDQEAAIKEYFPEGFAVRDSQGQIRASDADDETYNWGLRRFIDEAQTLARLRHPNALPNLDAPEAKVSSGRGILLIRSFMDEVRWNSNGNRITMCKKLAET